MSASPKIREFRRKVLLDRAVTVMLEAIPDFAMILSEKNEIVAVNTPLMKTFGQGSDETLIGLKPGNGIGCVFSTEGPNGCGSGLHCSACGTARSIAESHSTGKKAQYECRICLSTDEGAALDLLVTATPIDVDGIPLTVCVLRDISADKRRKILENVFFHDVINTAGGIRGIAAALGSKIVPAEQQEGYQEWLVRLSDKLIDEINHQRKLVEAERGEFRPEMNIVSARDIMNEVRALYGSYEAMGECRLVVEESNGITLISDTSILRKILGNLVKNAIEATAGGGTVTLGCRDHGDEVTFFVNNPGTIPSEVALQIFQRSFSTKASQGRGIGTYSVKLFGERYLKGRVAFTSREEEGTTFTFTLQKSNPDFLRRSAPAAAQ